jgi:hypothetical protein
MEDPRNQGPVTPNRPALVAIATVASSLGLLPYLAFIDHVEYVSVIAIGVAIAASIALQNIRTAATSHPSPVEWLLGAWSAVSYPAVGSLLAMMLYGLVYGGTKVFLVAASYFWIAPSIDSSRWAFFGSIWVLASIMLVAPTEGMRGVARQLYPREAWAHSAFALLAAKKRRLAIYAAACVLALGAMLWFLDPRGVALPILASLFLFYTSLPLRELGERPRDTSHPALVNALATALESGGYQIVRAPRTGKAEIDPLLEPVDLVARHDTRAFAVAVTSVRPDVPAEWNEATAVRTAATVLSDELFADDGSPLEVQPLLMVVGGRIAQSLQALSQREGVPVLHFSNVADAVDAPRLVQRLSDAGVIFPDRAASRA